MFAEELKRSIAGALKSLSITALDIKLEHPEAFSHGDYSTNVALACARELKMNPRAVAEKISGELRKNMPPGVEKIEVAGAGFINFYLKREVFGQEISKIIKEKEDYGKNKSLAGRKLMIEYTDPNAFKPFHIGHLMANSIGESISRIIEFSGTKVIRVCYPSDIGLHIAKAVWAIMKDIKNFPKESADLIKKTDFLGKAYVEGAAAYEKDPEAKKEIEEINQKLFDKSDKETQKIYEQGKRWSLEHFEEIYKKVGTHFDVEIFESEAVKPGEKIVEEFLKEGVFEKSEGATIFKGEKYLPAPGKVRQASGLHTRVFINSKGLPTYETKELGLNFKKFELFPDASESIIVTANEQNDYFKVLIKVLELVAPEIGKKTKHIGHGMLRFTSGKMSSRKGNIITAEALIAEVEKLVEQKIKDRGYDKKLEKEIIEAVGIGAIKYSILKQAIGGDIIYDFDKSISFEGDSGPYLQYAYARAKSVLEKANKEKVQSSTKNIPAGISEFERLLPRFPEIVERSEKEKMPHHIASYLIELSGAFNSFYAKEQIVDKADKYSPYKIALAESFATVMKNGLWLLGINVPSRM